MPDPQEALHEFEQSHGIKQKRVNHCRLGSEKAGHVTVQAAGVRRKDTGGPLSTFQETFTGV